MKIRMERDFRSAVISQYSAVISQYSAVISQYSAVISQYSAVISQYSAVKKVKKERILQMIISLQYSNM